jgi:hypothetical protein
MTLRPVRVVVALLIWLVANFAATAPGPSAWSAPARLGDPEFWKMASSFSEPDGTFHSENLVSNELGFQSLIPLLQKAVVQGRAYVGVGSEQNFSYIAASRPAVAFIVDIRRGNFDLHLLYKAIFELSSDRADFVSRLFSRKRPAGLTAQSTPNTIFAAYARVPASEDLYTRNLAAIERHLTSTHGFPLTRDDRRGIEYVYNAWYTAGPDIHYELNTGGFGGRRGPGGFPSYADLMTTPDSTGRNRSFLADEATFRVVQDLETRNLVVPVVGNFAGPKALRSVASYLRRSGVTVSAFYVSNVEQYLRQDGLWGRFCANVSALPVDGTSVFIRSTRGGFSGRPFGIAGGGFGLALASIAPEVAGCAAR